MKFKKFLKYITFLLLIGSLGFLYSFSLKRNSKKIVKDFNAVRKISSVDQISRLITTHLISANIDREKDASGKEFRYTDPTRFFLDTGFEENVRAAAK